MASKDDIELGEMMGEYAADPLRFVRECYHWGEGELAASKGPDPIQTEFLISLGEEVRKRKFDVLNPIPVMPIKMAESSGHGVGKSALGAWLVNWIMSTRPGCQITVTAGTAQQLETRTWAAIRVWTGRCITRSWWEVQADVIYARPHILPDGMPKEDWKCSAQTCKEENAQSFAGQHAARSSSVYIFDEASAVPDGIYTVAEGGLTDGESMWFLWGQMERNTGEFFRACFGDLKERWNVRQVDSRESSFTNKELLEQYIDDHGIDSDLVRVRILGLPPAAAEGQFIDWDRIKAAQEREIMVFPDEPLIAGVDCSGGGAAWNVVRFRRGFDGRSIPPIRIPGSRTKNDPHVLTAALAEVLRDQRPERRIAAMFIDVAFGAHIAERLRTMGFHQVNTVNFGGESPNPLAFNWRAAMWRAGKDWLLLGGIPKNDKDLANDFAAPGSKLSPKQKTIIESKESMKDRKVKSPDDGDAFMLTFAMPVGVQHVPQKPKPPRPVSRYSYMG